MERRWIAVGSALAFLGVALGAFGAHALKARVAPELLGTWRTAVEYQMYHAIGLVSIASVEIPPRLRTAVGALFLAGIGLFSGSLYALVLTDVRALGAITPLGGVSFLVGWAVLAAGTIRR